MDAGTVLGWVATALVGLLGKVYWDQSSGRLHKFFSRPPGPDAKSARLISAHWLEPERDEDRWRHTLEIRNNSEVTILVTHAVMPDASVRVPGAARAGVVIREHWFSVEQVRTEPHIQFVLSDFGWELSGENVRSLETDQEKSVREATDRKAKDRRAAALGVGLAPVLLLGYLAYQDRIQASQPDSFDYVVTPSKTGPNPFAGVDGPRFPGPDISYAEAWEAGYIIPTYALQPASASIVPDEVRERGTTVTIDCVDAGAPAGEPMARDLFGDWIWLRDLTTKSPGQQAPECHLSR